MNYWKQKGCITNSFTLILIIKMSNEETLERDLEPQQCQQLYWEEDVPLKDVRKSVLRKFVHIGCILCLLLGTIGFCVKLPDQVVLPFIIMNNQSEQLYRFSYPVYVTEKYTQPNDTIIKGQRLVRITSPEIVDLINNYREAEQNLLNFSSSKVLAFEKEIIKNRMQQNRINIAEVQTELAILENKARSNLATAEYEKEATQKRYQVMKDLYEAKVSSKFELMEYEARKNRAADELESAKQNYQKAKHSLAALQSKYSLDTILAMEELGKATYNVKHDSAYLDNQYALAKNKIQNTFGDFELEGGDLILKGRAKGVVSYEFNGEKEVPAGSILLKIIHYTPDCYALVNSPPSKVGRLKSGKAVVLKVASFPFYEWGTLKGYIENVSLTPDENGKFLVKVFIQGYGRLKNLIQLGMNGDATVILEEQTIYDYFFRGLKRKYHNVTR